MQDHFHDCNAGSVINGSSSAYLRETPRNLPSTQRHARCCTSRVRNRTRAETTRSTELLAEDIDLEDPAIRRVMASFGRERGAHLVREILAELCLETVRTPDERYRFATALLSRGGLAEALGRALKVHAILHGATGE